MSTVTELKLMTLLNVSAIKRPRDLDQPGGFRGSPSLSRSPSAPPAREDRQLEHVAKKKKNVIWGGELGPSGSSYGKNGRGKAAERNVKSHQESEPAAVPPELNEYEVDDSDEDEGTEITVDDNFVAHYGPAPHILTAESTRAVDDNAWDATRLGMSGYGSVVQMVPKGAAVEIPKNRITPSLLASLQSFKPLTNTALSHLGKYQDLYVHSLDGEADGTEEKLFGDQKESMRSAVMIHAINHVLKTRRRIVRNNEKLAKNPNIDSPRDSSFTRPKVLLLLPLRSLALHYLSTHLFPLAGHDTQIENLKPFTSSFGIPPDVTDPLSTPESASSFPVDHLVNFRGNSDDNFRFGIKITRKAWRIVMPPANEEKLLDCDIIVASPLGLKMSAEKEKSTDLLSSIEICVADGLDVMQMQNWEHAQFVFENLNRIPDNPHGCDFSRVKPWYLDEQAKYLRQTCLISRYDTPEARALFHRYCYNLQGKLRLEKADFEGVLNQVRSGVRQVFERIDQGSKGVDGAIEEVEQRLDWFTKKTIPALLKSAVTRQNTIIIVPSYFDFIRLNNHLRKADNISYAAISEYSSNSEIGRARTLFFKGKKSFLIVTERFHFYRRYKIRGAKTLVFYGLPDHAQFYAEFMQTPFLPGRNGQGEMVEIDEAEVRSRVLFSRFDALRLERVAGSENSRRMLASEDARFEFV